ncbi:MAG: hypothetical protein C3F02_00970 [Parcubacteria group bacterium]|nr:MAG: hypothetical protein C3F02_00970 [Parcubacteria group bacterium]
MSYQFNWPVFGHREQLKFLQNAVSENKLANTYLFYGPAGLGKKFVARYFVQSIYCQDEKIRPCQKCRACQAITKGIYPDVYELGKNKQELSIDNVRELLHSLALSPVHGAHRVALIYGIDQINLYGANALLKTLEEPGRDTSIIMIGDSLAGLPATVMSRSQLLKFKPLNNHDMRDWVASYNFLHEEQDTIINLSFGKPGLALTMIADKLVNFKKSCNFIIKLLAHGTFYYMQTIDKWFGILKKEHPEYKVFELGALTKRYLDLLEVFLRDILWIKLERPVVNQMYQSELELLAEQFDKDRLVRGLLSLEDIKNKLRHNVSPQLLWENLFLSLK